jgi:hypothetical protein
MPKLRNRIDPCVAEFLKEPKVDRDREIPKVSQCLDAKESDSDFTCKQASRTRDL